jgi:Cys-tRNA(Pro)/Cys-tRNA(Cys) deacylase
MGSGATRALDVLVRAGVVHAVREYAVHEPGGGERGRRPAWGEDAATALGVDPARIHKTLIAAVDGRLAVAMVPVAAELDLKALAGALGGRKATMADPAEAERATGYVRGGISPLGQRRRLPTVLDAAALDRPTILVSAGRRGLQVELAPADLVRLSGAIVAAIARRA